MQYEEVKVQELDATVTELRRDRYSRYLYRNASVTVISANFTLASFCQHLETKMLRTRSALCYRAFARAYATSPSPHALVFLEHREGILDSGSLSALTAAGQLGGEVTGLVVGGPNELDSVVAKAKK